MKRIFIIEPFHSLIDVITNSSTELFISDTDKSVDIWDVLDNTFNAEHFHLG